MDHHHKRSSKHYEKLPWTLIPMHPVVDDNVAAPVDPCIPQRPFTELDFEGHRAHTVYVGVHVPARRSHRRRKHMPPKESSDKGLHDSQERPATPPAQRVQFILGEDVNGEDGIGVAPPLESHPLFSEMEELVKDGDEIEWKETARWVKFEEDVEEGGNRWSKPHVATLSLHSLFELRNLILTGSVMLDMEATSLEQVADLVTENMTNSGILPFDSKMKVKEALLRRHRHQHEKEMKKGGPSTVNMSRLPIIRSLADIGKNHSSAKIKDDHSPFGVTTTTFVVHAGGSTSQENQPAKVDEHHQNSNSPPGSNTACGLKHGNNGSGANFLTVPGKKSFDQVPSIISPSSTSQMLRNVSSSDFQGLDHHRINFNFMRKIPPGAEASNILVGEVDFLTKTLSAFIRLNQATVMGDLTEVPVPTRFIFVLLGPPGSQTTFHEIGRSMATLMSDEVFHEVAYRARKRDHLIAGIDEFLDAVTVLPPGEWDPSIRIEPPAAIPSQEVRKRPPEKQPKKEEPDEEEEEQRIREESGLSRSGRLFGGLINDVKRKKPFYLSDFKDGCNLQSVASWIFLYFACLSPIVTFGGLLAEATGQNMAAMESLVSGFVCGIVYGFFSGQPLTILGSTGPVLVFETIVYEFCALVDWDYMAFRFWIGTWVAVILLILVAIDASAFVCYITRFTEENFATLIAFIFIYKAIENTFAIAGKVNKEGCFCELPPGYEGEKLQLISDSSEFNFTSCELKGKLIGDCFSTPYASPIFLMSFLLFAFTFIISTTLKDFKNRLFFPANVRQFISDFSVIIAISSMTLIDYITNIPTPKLQVPHEFKPTLEGRGWIISPYHERNPFYSCIIAVIPALLGTILIFMDQQITAVIINRKENKLKKGCGYHLDLFILAILIQICTIVGCPWFVAATVLSITHVNSLKLESETAAPGEKPQFLGVREQRVTHIMIFLTIGCSVKLTPLLSHIPMPVLFGVFLYMGAASLKGLQFYDRMLIVLMPQKYQPDYMFLRQVPISRVHLFTIIQLTCLVCLWVIKSFQATSILFPLMLVVMIGVRKSLDCIFTRRELKILDDIMPEMVRQSGDDDLHHLEDGNGGNAEVGIFKKFVACCIGEKPDKLKKRNSNMHS
ncbi:hypothetical protein ACKWTF_002028 [Chironomus riparius]